MKYPLPSLAPLESLFDTLTIPELLITRAALNYTQHNLWKGRSTRPPTDKHHTKYICFTMLMYKPVDSYLLEQVNNRITGCLGPYATYQGWLTSNRPTPEPLSDRTIQEQRLRFIRHIIWTLNHHVNSI